MQYLRGISFGVSIHARAYALTLMITPTRSRALSLSSRVKALPGSFLLTAINLNEDASLGIRFRGLRFAENSVPSGS